MYSAPDYVKIELKQENVFSSSCQPGHKVTDTDFFGDDLSGCKDIVITGGDLEYECYFSLNM